MFALHFNLSTLKYLSADRIHNGRHWLPDESVIAIAEDGTIHSILPPGEVAPEKVEHYKGILCPGFVNAHCHLELSHMKGVVAQGNRLVPFLQSVMLGRNNFSEEEKRTKCGFSYSYFC
jgi:cytosine/adenosine deaminase-related metal-dependent hydrolase